MDLTSGRLWVLLPCARPAENDFHALADSYLAVGITVVARWSCVRAAHRSRERHPGRVEPEHSVPRLPRSGHAHLPRCCSAAERDLVTACHR